jgi:hypothetical protein
MSFSIVVARYNENVEWTKQFSNVIIYNKGTPLSDEFNQILLSNVGREGHTYYKYIYDNYDSLDDYTVFLQGNPFDHSPHLIMNLNNYINTKDINIDFEFLSERVIKSNISNCPYHRGLPLKDTYEKIFDKRKEDMELIFGAGAQFIVSKKLILNKPKSFYLKIVEILQNHINPIEGFVLERFHKMIFESELHE